MKAKFLLGALVFPMIFGACTNDLFEQEPVSLPENSVLAGREKVNVSLNVERVGAEAPQTRVDGYWDGSGIQWAWRDKKDGMGAVVVDYLPGDEIVNKNTPGYEDYVITNYPFYPQIEQSSKSANFRTPTAVVEGAYLFYSQYDGDMIERGQIVDEIPRLQTVKPGFDNGVLQIGSERTNGIGQNFFVSPIVNVGVKHEADFELPLALTSAHSILHIRLDANLESKYYGENGLSINKIVLRALDDTNTPFNRKLTLNPIDIANLQKEVKTANPTLPIDDRGVINGLAEPSEVTKALNAVLNKIMSIEGGEVDTDAPVSKIGDYSEATEDKSSDLVYQLVEPFVFEKEGDVMDLLVIMPAGTYNGKSGLKEYEGKTEGALRLTVYTSEGTYDTYIGGGTGKTITAHRAEKINVKRTLEIMGGKTNINLFDPNQGFDIESTQDWNFTMEYIKNHLRDFGNGSNWKKPVLNLVEGQTIEVDPEHYFLDYPVEYKGNATLKLIDQSEYVINPNNVILDETNRPTILIEGQPESTVKFEDPAENATEFTDAYKLVSDAKVIVDNAQSLTFEKLVSYTAMQVGTNAKVNIDSEEDVVLNGDNTFAAGSSVTAITTGKVTLNNATLNNAVAVTLNGATNETTGTLDVNANAALTVNGIYTNEAVATIDGNATATLNGVSVNEGEINVKVEGALNATKASFTNNGSLTLKGTEKEMDDDARSKATFKELVNNNTIVVENGGTNKGTYGGCLTVNTKVTNNVNGTISVNGEFFATTATGTNYGVVKLMGDKYAVIQLSGSKFKSQNDGYIEITDPTAYEMFNTYYTIHNDLTGVEGPIVATLSQENWPTVWSNYKKYNGAQETAWSVINTIRVEGTLEFTQEQTAAVEAKDLILSETSGIKNAETSANKTLKFNNIIVEKNAKATFESAVACSMKCANINIEEGATLDNNKNVKVFVEPALDYPTANTNADNTMLTVNGTLNNNGEIHTTVAEKSVLKAIVGKGAFINNYGKMGTAAKNNVNWSKSELNNIDAINGEFSDFVYTHYVRESENPDLSLSTELANSTTKRTWALFVAWQNATPDSKGIFSYNGKYYKVSVSDSNTTEVEPALTAQQKNMLVENFTTMRNNYKYDGNKNLINNAVKSTWSTSGSTYVKFYGHIQDFIFIYLNEGTVVLNNPGATAYGFIKDNTNGTLTGTFTQDYSSDF